MPTKQTSRALAKQLRKVEEARGRLAELAHRIGTSADTITELLRVADSLFGAAPPAPKPAATAPKRTTTRNPASAAPKPATTAGKRAPAKRTAAVAPKRAATARRPASPTPKPATTAVKRAPAKRTPTVAPKRAARRPRAG